MVVQADSMHSIAGPSKQVEVTFNREGAIVALSHGATGIDWKQEWVNDIEFDATEVFESQLYFPEEC